MKSSVGTTFAAKMGPLVALIRLLDNFIFKLYFLGTRGGNFCCIETSVYTLLRVTVTLVIVSPVLMAVKLDPGFTITITIHFPRGLVVFVVRLTFVYIVGGSIFELGVSVAGSWCGVDRFGACTGDFRTITGLHLRDVHTLLRVLNGPRGGLGFVRITNAGKGNSIYTCLRGVLALSKLGAKGCASPGVVDIYREVGVSNGSVSGDRVRHLVRGIHLNTRGIGSGLKRVPAPFRV